MIRENQQSKKTKNKHPKIQNLITSTKSRVLKNTKIYQLKTKMQEKKNQPKNWERERERIFFVRKNFAKNGRKNDKFIVKCVNKKIQNKGRWREIWRVILK